MARQQYTLRVRYSPGAVPTRRRRNGRSASLTPFKPQPVRDDHRPMGSAARGLVLGLPIAAVLWAPLLWGLSRLI